MAYIYCADIFCDDCGKAICDRLTSEGSAPADPSRYDSGDFPKYVGDVGESDTPEHCGRGENCLNAIELSTGKVGLLMGDLTQDGIDYVKEAIADSINETCSWCREVANLWQTYYRDRGYDL